MTLINETRVQALLDESSMLITQQPELRDPVAMADALAAWMGLGFDLMHGFRDIDVARDLECADGI